jgi:LysM repeat protein
MRGNSQVQIPKEYLNTVNREGNVPPLVLTDWSLPTPSHTPLPQHLSLIERQPETKRLLKPVVHYERLVLIVLATLGLLTLGYRAGRAVQTHSQIAVAPVVIHTVKAGDTLWSIAKRYGNPNTYILERIADVESLNPKTASAPLHVGDSVRVRVENPVLVAQMSPKIARR